MRAVLIAAALLAAVAGTGRAEPERAGDRSEIDRLIDRAETAYARRDYTAAIAELRAAYDVEPRPWLLFNIAQAYRLAGDDAAALDYYQRFVAIEPDGQVADQARTKIAALREAVERAAPPPPVSAETTLTPFPPADVAAVGSRSNRMLWTGGSIAAAGLAAVGVGVFYGIEAREASDEVSRFRGAVWTDEILARQADGKSAERRMIGFVVLGGVGVAAGAALVYAALATEPGDLRVAPGAGTGAAGITIEGEF